MWRSDVGWYDHTRSTTDGMCFFAAEWVEPVQWRAVRNVSLPLPHSPEQVLAHVYGDDWRTPELRGHFLDTDCSSNVL
jgi:hypothetical protein